MGYGSQGLKESDTTEATKHACTHVDQRGSSWPKLKIEEVVGISFD